EAAFSGALVLEAPSVPPTLPALGSESVFFVVPAFTGPSTGPPCLASIAAMTSLLRIRPVPVMPRLDATFGRSGSCSAASPVPRVAARDRDEGALFGVASPVSAPEASVVALLSTAASVWSSVVSLTKGPSQGAGFGRQHVAGSAGPVVRT